MPSLAAIRPPIAARGLARVASPESAGFRSSSELGRSRRVGCLHPSRNSVGPPLDPLFLFIACCSTAGVLVVACSDDWGSGIAAAFVEQKEENNDIILYMYLIRHSGFVGCTSRLSLSIVCQLMGLGLELLGQEKVS